MINFNGDISHSNAISMSIQNRGLAYGDALFETIKIANGNVLFWEDHYFRLMASMRILRMEIPMTFTLEFLEEEILMTLKSNKDIGDSARVKLTVIRKEGGLYDPQTNAVDYLISVAPLEMSRYVINTHDYKVELFKDFFIAPGLLSNLKTNNRVLNVVGSIFARENDFDNCLLLNTNKQVIEALNSNVFMVNGNTIKTPPLEDGCIKGILRKQLIAIVNSLDDFELDESSISPFELQKADELFLTNVITGIQPITAYRKKSYAAKTSALLIEQLNKKIEV